MHLLKAVHISSRPEKCNPKMPAQVAISKALLPGHLTVNLADFRICVFPLKHLCFLGALSRAPFKDIINIHPRNLA